MQIPKSFLENQVFQSNPLGFNRQMPLRTRPAFPPNNGGAVIPGGAIAREDGTVEVAFYAPEASSVTAFHGDVSVQLVKNEDGVWSGLLPYSEPGFKQLGFTVDGVRVLNRMAPIGFGSSAPLNYVEIPDVECDFLLIKNVPHGSVNQEFFYSKTTGQYESCLVYTPPEYQKDWNVTYPVLYLQHGGGENETSWVHQGKINFTMDNLIAEGKAVPCLIVMCNGMVQMPGADGVRATDYDAFEKLLLEDAIPFIESIYRVKAERSSWSIRTCLSPPGSLPATPRRDSTRKRSRT